MAAQPQKAIRSLLARPRGKVIAVVVAVLFVYAGLGVWALIGDEPKWVDVITDPVAHLVFKIRRLL